MRIPVATLFLALMAAAPGAQAVIACNASVTNVSTSFDPAVGVTVTGGWTVNCTRAGGDPNTFDFSLGVNNGSNPQGLNKRVKHTGLNSYYTYQTYRPNNQPWLNFFGFGRFQGTVDFGGLTFGSESGTFEVRAGAQAAGPAGTYIDTLTWTLYSGSGFFAQNIGSGVFTVVFITNPVCSISSIPNLTFNYSSFQAGSAFASSNFTVTCSNLLYYTMALDNAGPITDNAVNLAYMLSLSAPDGTGTGLAQTYSVNGTMAGGQSGTCATATCTNAAATNKTRTLTVSY